LGTTREIEIKLQVVDAAQARRRLEAAGFATLAGRMFERNTLFDDPGLRLRARGELLRVRRVGAETVLTFKGPATPGKHKSREEIEIRVSDAGALEIILVRLGLQPSYRYEKYRTEFSRAGEPGVVALDETPIGVFFEVEGPGEWIDRVASELGFSQPDYITASYATLHLDYCRERGLDPGAGMVFRPEPAKTE
jgi:adenylate cyclase class 2